MGSARKVEVHAIANASEAGIASFEVAIFVSSSPRPRSYRAQKQLLPPFCRDGCGGEG